MSLEPDNKNVRKVVLSLEVVVGERLMLPKRHTGHVTQIVAIDSSNTIALPKKLRDLCSIASSNFGGGLLFEAKVAETSTAKVRPSHVRIHRKPVVLVNGSGLALGMERASFELKNLRQFVFGSKDALEVLFRTESGNVYGLIRARKGGSLLLNARYGKEASVPTERLGMLTLRLGERVTLNANAQTSPFPR